MVQPSGWVTSSILTLCKKKNSFFLPNGTDIDCDIDCDSVILRKKMPSKNDMLIVGQDDHQFIKPMLFQGLSFSRANNYFLAPESWFDRDSFKFRDLEHIDPFSVLTQYNGYPWKITLNSIMYTLNKYYHELQQSTIYCIYVDNSPVDLTRMNKLSDFDWKYHLSKGRPMPKPVKWGMGPTYVTCEPLRWEVGDKSFQIHLLYVTCEDTLRAFIDKTLGDATSFSDPFGGDMQSQLQLGGLRDMEHLTARMKGGTIASTPDPVPLDEFQAITKLPKTYYSDYLRVLPNHSSVQFNLSIRLTTDDWRKYADEFFAEHCLCVPFSQRYNKSRFKRETNLKSADFAVYQKIMNKDKKRLGAELFLKLADFYIKYPALSARDYTGYVRDFLSMYGSD